MMETESLLKSNENARNMLWTLGRKSSSFGGFSDDVILWEVFYKILQRHLEAIIKEIIWGYLILKFEILLRKYHCCSFVNVAKIWRNFEPKKISSAKCRSATYESVFLDNRTTLHPPSKLPQNLTFPLNEPSLFVLVFHCVGVMSWNIMMRLCKYGRARRDCSWELWCLMASRTFKHIIEVRHE